MELRLNDMQKQYKVDAQPQNEYTDLLPADTNYYPHTERGLRSSTRSVKQTLSDFN